MDKSREQFEEWAKENLRCDLSHNGEYYNHSNAYHAWKGWQASRAALVVQLPDAFDSSKEDASYYEYAYLQSEVEQSLNAAGVSYK